MDSYPGYYMYVTFNRLFHCFFLLFSAQVSVDGSDLSITGGSLGGQYNFAQFHFHWGPNDNSGSEHTMDGDMYPLEVTQKFQT